MSAINRSIAVLGGVLMLTCAAIADTNQSMLDNYMCIVDRNAFALKDPPPPADPNAAPPAVAVNILLTATSNFGGAKKAYFKVPGTGKDANVFTFPILKEGEQEGSIKVLEIDEKGGSVKILNAGVPTTLTFEANGNKPIVGGPPPGQPGAPIVPGLPGIGNPPPRTPGFNRPGLTPMPTPIPVREVRAQPSSQDNQQAYITSHLNMEINRAAMAPAIASGDAPPLPPSDLSEPVVPH